MIDCPEPRITSQFQAAVLYSFSLPPRCQNISESGHAQAHEFFVRCGRTRPEHFEALALGGRVKLFVIADEIEILHLPGRIFMRIDSTHQLNGVMGFQGMKSKHPH